MSEPVKIAIVVRDGGVLEVLTAGVPVSYVVVDYDTESEDICNLSDVPQDDGKSEWAHVSPPIDAEIRGTFVLDAHSDAFPAAEEKEEG